MQMALLKRWSRPCFQQTRRQIHALLIVALLVTSSRGDAFPTPKLADVDPAGISGVLIVYGGGKLSDAALDRFLELAGGDKARLVVIPTATEKADDVELDSYATTWRNRGFRTVDVLHTCDRTVADSDAFTAPLKSATAVWFVGGQQSRLSKAYIGTRVEEELYALLERGGAIGGNSAGATIQGDYLVRGNPLGNQDMMAEGYERGFGFLPGCAIDQHFTQRGRHRDMEALMRAFPQLLGIGIDESTALVVQQTTAHVIGEKDVYFFDASPSEEPDRPDFTKVAPSKQRKSTANGMAGTTTSSPKATPWTASSRACRKRLANSSRWQPAAGPVSRSSSITR